MKPLLTTLSILTIGSSIGNLGNLINTNINIWQGNKVKSFNDYPSLYGFC